LAIQWMDDFTSYGTNAARLLDGSYAENAFVDLPTDPDPSATANPVFRVQAGTGLLRRVLSSAQTTIGVAGRYWLNTLPLDVNARPRFANIRDTGNRDHCYITSDPSGYLQAYRADSGGDVLVGTSSSPVVIASAWRHIEVQFVLDIAAGSITVRLEGQTVLSVTGIRTISNTSGIAATGQNVVLEYTRSGATAGSMYVKDFIIWDGSGSANNTFMGSCQVYKIVPDADITLNWTPSTGTAGWSLINESTPSDDVGYISAAASVSPSTFSLTDLPTNVTSVKGVMAVHRSKKTDGGDGQLQLSLVSGANTGAGTDRTITTAYTYWADIFDKDPSGSAWSKTLVNALQVKLNRTV
jgi:hypothetical protein